jgi:hypothetical protein
MREINIFLCIELTGDELAAVIGGQLANYAYSPSVTGGPLGVGPGIGPGFISGGIDSNLFYQGLCDVCGTAPGVFTLGGVGGGPFTSALNTGNTNAVGGNIFRNNFYTVIN